MFDALLDVSWIRVESAGKHLGALSHKVDVLDSPTCLHDLYDGRLNRVPPIVFNLALNLALLALLGRL